MSTTKASNDSNKSAVGLIFLLYGIATARKDACQVRFMTWKDLLNFYEDQEAREVDSSPIYAETGYKFTIIDHHCPSSRHRRRPQFSSIFHCRTSPPQLAIASPRLCLASPPIDSLPEAYFSLHFFLSSSALFLTRSMTISPPFTSLCTLLASIGFMIVFVIPVTVVQGLLHLEGPQKRLPFLSGVLKSRKKSACCKVLYFLIWNVFFVNVLSGKVIERLSVVSSPKDVTAQLATAVPTQATFFMTYILSSGWASLSFELLQPYALLCNLFYKFILRNKEDPCTLSFPYHTKIPRVLLLGFLGFTYSIMAPLILPFLPVYFFLAYLVYRNQVLIELDRKDELCGRMDEMYKKFPKAYSQFPSTSNDLCKDIPLSHCEDRDGNTRLQDLEDIKPGNLPIQSWMKTLFLGRFYSVHNFVANLQQNDLRTEVLGICVDCRGGYDID
ncbi:hypothetical protein TEA_022511 [Camellia sinensis var. sinensis]|uniref:CSC1/OSCA1-like 7TM region domain-containing protein n=1 Tax=Camellia sinensis var. sinensis TaxID=542762 RepID=A0A4S4DUW7_CAMSN|nr:hypothetical protein TEA_022511 [Camellia sinensis var. sinensis]